MLYNTELSYGTRVVEEEEEEQNRTRLSNTEIGRQRNPNVTRERNNARTVL